MDFRKLDADIDDAQDSMQAFRMGCDDIKLAERIDAVDNALYYLRNAIRLLENGSELK